MIPSLGIGDPDHSETDVSEVEVSKPSSPKVSNSIFICLQKENHFIIYFYFNFKAICRSGLHIPMELVCV